MTVHKVVNGVKMGEGDGTVTLLSLGAMCVDGWQRKKWNPAGIKVVTVEVSPRFLCAANMLVLTHVVFTSVSFLIIQHQPSRVVVQIRATTWTSSVPPG